MKLSISFLGIVFLFFFQVFFSDGKVSADERCYKNFYGIVWSEKPAEDVKYARQMGYDYIAINPSSTPKDYYNNPDCAGLKFYFVDPQWYPQVVSGYSRSIDITKPISDAEKDFYNQRMVWKGNDPFPYNLATGYHPIGDSTKFTVMWDFQQQAVIDEVVENIIGLAKRYEDASLPFTFGGYIIEEPKLAGEFYRLDENGNNVSVGLSYWTGVDSGLVHGTITHEYATYSEGKAAFYKKLRARLAHEFTNPKWIIRPTWLYNEVDNDEWIYQIKDRADKDELTPDMLSQGSKQNTNFVDDANNFNSGVNITKDKVGNSQASEADEYTNRFFAAKAGINGAWYNWFGRFGGTGDMPGFEGVTKVYPRLKLIRCLPNWDNLNNVPLTDRSWDGNVYQSTKSYASGDVMYSRHPKTGKLFAVFLTIGGVITLNPGETVTSVERTDGFFIESGDGNADVEITGNEIHLKSRKNIGKGYIFTVSSDAHTGTGTETDETSGTEVPGRSNESHVLPVMGVFEHGKSRDSGSSRSSIDKGTNHTKGLTSQQSISVQTWQQVAIRTKAQKTAGLSGGEGFQEIYCMDWSRSNPNVIYVVVDQSGPYKSTDGGVTWTRKHKGFRAVGGTSVAIHPTNENIVFVAGGALDWGDPSNDYMGIFRTTNGGENWTRVYDTQVSLPSHNSGAKGGKLIAFTNNGTTIYAGCDNSGLLRSTDGGNTWVKVPKFGGGYVLSGNRIYDIKVHPSNNTTLFICTNYGFYKITNSNGTATQTKISVPLGMIPGTCAIHPTNGDIIYLSVGTKGIYKTTNGGTTWSASNTGITLDGIQLMTGLTISPADGNYLHLCAKSSEVYYSHNGGTSWSKPTSQDEKNADGWVSRSVEDNIDASERPNYWGGTTAAHPTNRNIAIFNGTSNRVKKTTDGGVNWRYSATGWSGGRTVVFDWAKNNPGKLVKFLMDYGPYITENNEDTFKYSNAPLYQDRRTSSAGAIDPYDSNTIIAAMGTWSTQQLYITHNNGASWKVISGTSGSYSYIAFKSHTEIYANNLLITIKYNTSPISYTVSQRSKAVCAVYPGNRNIVYAIGASGDSTIIYKSTDGGSTWTTPYPLLSVSRDSIGTIAVYPNNPDKLCIAAYYYGVCIINGNTVTTKSLPKDQLGTISTKYVAIDPNNSNIIYAGSRHSWQGQGNGVFRSTDGGNTWENITGNLGPEFTVWGLAVNPHNSYVYVGSSNGTWKLPPPGTSGTAPMATTGSTTNITSSSATLNGTVNANGLSTTAWFEYGTTSGSYGSTSSTQSVSGSSNTTVSIGISGLSASTTYYYRLVAQNSAGTQYGSEKSFASASGAGVTSGPQAYYALDEGSGTTATDESGNGNSGTVTGATWTTGKSGGGLSFDGNDYITKTNPSSGVKPSSEVAIAAWIKTSVTDTGGAEVVSMGDSYALRVEKDGNIKFFYYNGSGYKSVRTTGVNVLNGAWHHIVGQKTGATLQIYVDGSSKISTSNTGTIRYTLGTNLYIGNHGNGGTSYDFRGSIDDVRIYNQALSNQEALDLYNSTSTVITEEQQTYGPQAYYTLNEGSGTTATDASGNGNNGSVTGATWTTGKSGGGLGFDGNDYVVKTNPSSGVKPSSEVAIAAWIKTSVTDTGGAEVVSMGDSYALRVEKDGNIKFFYYNGSGYKSVRTTGVNVLNGAWHHIVGQKTGATLQIYVDGSSKISTSNTGTVRYTLGTGLFVGNHGNGGTTYDFKGSIDDVRIYNQALSNQEVLDLYTGNV